MGAPPAARPNTFVLVHGAWGGAHGFRHVRRILRDDGHDVFVPALTGIGERVHLASPQVDLTTHVTDVVNLMRYWDLEDVVLVGFSYGGAVVTAALEHVADRVRALVYLDAFVPDDGQSMFDLVGPPPGDPTALGAPWLVPSPERRFDDPAEAAFALPRRTPHPIGCFTEPVRLARPLEEFPFSLTYVRATGTDPVETGYPAFDAAAARARGDARWRYREIETTHLVAHNRPREVADLLLEVAREE